MRLHLGVDIGGTFTDCVAIDQSGNSRNAKVLTTPLSPSDGVLEGLRELAASAGVPFHEMLEESSRFAHGTTISTNAVLERKGARVGLVTTRGHGDALDMMRGAGRVAGLPIERVYHLQGSSRPAPLVERHMVLELDERIDSHGRVVVALHQETATRKLQEFVERWQLESVAVVFLWSFANDSHERLLGRLLAELFPRVFVSLSVDVSPRLGEYERTVATVLNAYVGPASTRYLTRLGELLREEGLRPPPLVIQSNGGVLPFEEVRRDALGGIHSGPAGGLAGAAQLARSHQHENVIATDMGGTSLDVGLIIGGEGVVTDEDVIDRFSFRLPRLDVCSIACGGGTIARVDRLTRALRVGPDSAGAVPGPMCYRRGGDLPTVTDADIVLGLIRTEGFLGGRMPLDIDAARRGIGALADQLSLSIEEAAAGILRINNARASTLISQRTLERGFDPRDFVVYAYGGAGPVHAFAFVAELDVREVIIPLANGASTLSAYGIATTDLGRFVEKETLLVAPFDNELLTAGVEEITRAAQASLSHIAADSDVQVRVSALMRFREQLMHRLDVPLDLPVDAERLQRSFAEAYRLRYGAGALATFNTIEVFAWRAHARIVSGVSPPLQAAAVNAPPAPIASSNVFWPTAMRRIATAVYDGQELTVGAVLSGPALVELPHTTVAVPPSMQVSVLRSGCLQLTSTSRGTQ